jgi:hypothetical protein
VQGCCEVSFNGAEIDAAFDIGWAMQMHQNGSIKSGAFSRWATCLGVMVCENKCGYTGRPYTYKPSGVKSYKSRQFCRGACYEKGIGEEKRRLVLHACGVKMQWHRADASGPITFEQLGSHSHARPPLLKMTASEVADVQQSVTLGTPAKFCLPTSRARLRISMFGV